MDEPRIEILGVYRLELTGELLREHVSILYPSTSEAGIRAYLESVVLIEALVLNRDQRFDVGDFYQAKSDVPRDNWQAAWAEAYLSPDGTSLAVQRWLPAPDAGDMRVAFFIHLWDPALPLLSSYGDIACPQPQPMPDRLKHLVPYVAVD